MKFFLVGLLSILNSGTEAVAKTRNTEHVLLVMTDGLRWQEVFEGVDNHLFTDPVNHPNDFATRQKLLPFFWGVMATQGIVLGDPSKQNRFAVANGKNYSYPGYNEVLTGNVDGSINSNDPIPNKNETILDRLAKQPGFENKVAAAVSWNVLFSIINAKAPGVTVVGGRQSPPLQGPAWDSFRRLTAEITTPWSEVQFDALTHEEALELLSAKPKFLFVSYGETDEWAHKNDYAAYLKAAHRFDGYVKQLWEKAQSLEGWKGHTTLIITTDHGRGADAASWHSHGGKLPLSDRTWFAILGPDTDPHLNPLPTEGRLQQVAATVFQLLGLDLSAEDMRAAAPLALGMKQ